MISCIWKQHRKLHDQNLNWCVYCTQHALFISRKGTRILSGQAGFCRTMETLGLSVYLKPQWDNFAPCGSSSKPFFFMLKLSLCFRNLPAPNAAGKFLVLECMWNVEPSWKFVWIFCVCVRCVLPLPVWHVRCGGLADRAFERGFRMLCWWRDSLAHILCQPSPRGFAVCVPKWHFWLMLSAASPGQRNWGKGRTC